MSDEESQRELQRLLQQATEHEELWRAVLRTAVDPIIVIDGSGVIQRANPATSKLFGHPRGALLGHNISVLMPEPDRSAHDGYLANYRETGEAKIIGIGREVEAMKADGTVFPIHLAISDVESSGTTLYTGVIHDLTEINRQKQELLDLTSELEIRVSERTAELNASMTDLARSNRDLEQFAYIASHDLQAPLRNVRQGLELLEEHLLSTVGASFDSEANELRGLVLDAIGRMEDLIRGLLSFSRVERAHGGWQTPVDLAEVVDDVIVQLSVSLTDANASVVRSELPVVLGNEVQLRQVIQNLIENSLKYRNADDPPMIEISSSELEESRVVVSVADNGIGIDADQHERVFELFRRAHSGYEGVGLGLAICQRIVERHGGDIWVESQPSDGATFSFSLQAHEEEDEAGEFE